MADIRQQAKHTGNRTPELLRSGPKASWAPFMGRQPRTASSGLIFRGSPKISARIRDFRRACSHSFLPPLIKANCPQSVFPFPAYLRTTPGSRRICVCQMLHVAGIHLALTPSFRFCGALVLKAFRRTTPSGHTKNRALVVCKPSSAVMQCGHPL